MPQQMVTYSAIAQSLPKWQNIPPLSLNTLFYKTRCYANISRWLSVAMILALLDFIQQVALQSPIAEIFEKM